MGPKRVTFKALPELLLTSASQWGCILGCRRRLVQVASSGSSAVMSRGSRSRGYVSSKQVHPWSWVWQSKLGMLLLTV